MEEKFISGIHNYCDRWCERCAFTARCRVANAESGMTDEERDIENEAFWRKLTNIFAEAKTIMAEKAQEFGIEFELISDGEYAEHSRRKDEFTVNQDLTALAARYRKDAAKTLETKDDWLIFSALDEDLRNEMLSIIYWYQYFISVKIQRGFHGILDFEGKPDKEEINDSQSDANGSIKIALIAVERSIMAWTNLMTDEISAQIQPLISLLENIKQTAERKFPNAGDFVRPGFDEIEIVM